MEYGLLLASVKCTESCSCYCVLQKLEKICANGISVKNEMDCPLLEARTRYEVIPSTNVLSAISVVHECTGSCKLRPMQTTVVERENTVAITGQTVCHDKAKYLLLCKCLLYQ